VEIQKKNSAQIWGKKFWLLKNVAGVLEFFKICFVNFSKISRHFLKFLKNTHTMRGTFDPYFMPLCIDLRRGYDIIKHI